MKNFTPAELERMAASFGGITPTDRVKAFKCLRESGSRRRRIRIREPSSSPAS